MLSGIVAAVEIQELINEYYLLMQEMDPSFHWSDPNWWKDSEAAKLVVAENLQGFAIVGYGVNVDDDVASEICELYCKDTHVFMSLVHSCIPWLRWPFGFQVLKVNVKAQRLFERVAARGGYEVAKRECMDGESLVIKYRVIND